MTDRDEAGWSLFFADVAATMTEEHALLVERLRVGAEMSWRRVAEEFYDAYPDVLYGRPMRGNQGAGMALCEAASALLGREVD